jgi:hypothetical protein
MCLCVLNQQELAAAIHFDEIITSKQRRLEHFWIYDTFYIQWLW